MGVYGMVKGFLVRHDKVIVIPLELEKVLQDIGDVVYGNIWKGFLKGAHQVDDGKSPALTTAAGKAARSSPTRIPVRIA